MAVDLKELVDPASVRAAIDISLNNTLLPDDTIRLLIYVRPAMKTLKSFYADVESVTTEDDIEIVTQAMNLLVAANLLPSVPVLTQQRTATGNAYTRQAQDIKERVADLIQQAQSAISELSVLSDASPFSPIFDLACGGRGR